MNRRLPPKARLRLRVGGGRHNKSDWAFGQLTDPGHSDYWCAQTSGGQPLAGAIPEETGNRNQAIDFVVPQAGIEPGESVVIWVGGKSDTGPLATPQTFSQPDKEFEILLDSDGFEWLKQSTSPRIEVKGTTMHRLAVFVPSIVRPGERFRALVKAEDRFGNIAPSFQGRVRLAWEGQGATLSPGEYVFAERDQGVHTFQGLRLESEGVHRLVVSTDPGAYQSNPVVCSAQDTSRLHWGMIHGHTALSDGLGSPEAYYEYMRYGCGLDFGAIADHDHEWETSDEDWQHIQQATAQANAPGQFVTILGYEWAKWRQNGDGDRCVYYPTDNGPMLRSGDVFFPRPRDLYGALSPDALVIPHHTAYVGNHCDWKDHDPRRDRLVEIYSVWGNSERSVNDGNPNPVKAGRHQREYEDKTEDADEVPVGFVQNALAMGWRVGFTAGGDDHRGHPGDNYRPDRGPRQYTAGLTAVYAHQLTRASLWQALWNRRCYGTTGARMIVEFSVNGHPMGSEIRLRSPADPRIVRARVIGTGKVSKIDVVRNNRDLYTHHGTGYLEEFEWIDTDRLEDVLLPAAQHTPNPFVYYYVRITQDDGEMAWASPIWFSMH